MLFRSFSSSDVKEPLQDRPFGPPPQSPCRGTSPCSPCRCKFFMSGNLSMFILVHYYLFKDLHRKFLCSATLLCSKIKVDIKTRACGNIYISLQTSRNLKIINKNTQKLKDQQYSHLPPNPRVKSSNLE